MPKLQRPFIISRAWLTAFSVLAWRRVRWWLLDFTSNERLLPKSRESFRSNNQRNTNPSLLVFLDPAYEHYRWNWSGTVSQRKILAAS